MDSNISDIACRVYPPEDLHNYDKVLADEFSIPTYRIVGGPTLSHSSHDFFPRLRSIPPIIRLSKPFLRFIYRLWTPPKKFEKVITSGMISNQVSTASHQEKIQICHGPFPQPLDLPPWEAGPNIHGLYKKVTRKFIRYDNRRSFESSDTILANSQFTADILKRFWDINVDGIAPPPVDTGDYINNRPANDTFYLYLGRLDPTKRVGEIIEAFNQLPFRLIVAGTGSQEVALRNKAGKGVTVSGYVSPGQKRTLLSTCKAFIQNSIAEPFGMATIEALASGSPVLAVRSGNNPNLVVEGKNGLLYDRPGERDVFKTGDATEGIIETVWKAEQVNWDHQIISESVKKYDVHIFNDMWKKILSN